MLDRLRDELFAGLRLSGFAVALVIARAVGARGVLKLFDPPSTSQTEARVARFFLDKANPDILHVEMTTTDSSLTRPDRKSVV